MKMLCKERYIQMPDLAIRFNVSVRTIKRDIDELGYIIPLRIKSGRYTGGVYVLEGYSWDRIYMSIEDIELLREIASIGKNGEKLILSEESLKRLERIIMIYSAPQTNKIF